MACNESLGLLNWEEEMGKHSLYIMVNIIGFRYHERLAEKEVQGKKTLGILNLMSW